MSLNKVMLIGNLGTDPELKYTPGGQAVCNFSLATNEKWKDKSGALQERVEWHRIVVWGKQADSCKEYLAKGRSVYIEGKIQTRSWEDKDGQKRYATEVIAHDVKFLANAAKGERAGKNSPEPEHRTTTAVHETFGTGGKTTTRDEFGDDELPF